MSSSNLETYLRSYQTDSKLHSFQEPVRDDLARMQERLRDFFRSRVPLIQEVGEHLLGMSGKRFRPALTLLIARVEGEPARDPSLAAAAIELIHTATLVHDDTIDKSAMRRGLPTINAIYNDLVATILGDYIYTKVLVDLQDLGEDAIVRVLTRTTYQMSIGEMLQIQQKRRVDLSEEDYLELVDAKTASLMGASCEVGARTAGLPEEKADLLRAFGLDLGRAYQITDDVFDYVGDAGQLGKLAHSDLAEGKVTLPLVRAIQRCSAKEKGRISDILGSGTLTEEDWIFVLGLLRTYDALDDCRQIALESAKRAVERLDAFRPSPYLAGLRQAVDYAVTRIH